MKTVQNPKELTRPFLGGENGKCVIHETIVKSWLLLVNLHLAIPNKNVGQYWSKRRPHRYSVDLSVHYVIETEFNIRCGPQLPRPE